jgi:hypothetical protein
VAEAGKGAPPPGPRSIPHLSAPPATSADTPRGAHPQGLPAGLFMNLNFYIINSVCFYEQYKINSYIFKNILLFIIKLNS